MSGTDKITSSASDQLNEIADYTLAEWGPQQMTVYINALFDRFQWLADHPELGKFRPELASELRSYREGSHVVFYLPHTNRIDIIGVRHQSRDIERYFVGSIQLQRSLRNVRARSRPVSAASAS